MNPNPENVSANQQFVAHQRRRDVWQALWKTFRVPVDSGDHDYSAQAVRRPASHQQGPSESVSGKPCA